ncbi:hypothetical protein BC829DRAFT_422647 [Chytridium lagenaria]|nr:hypothetical protein BC829DRAFT_422647 [Chytridium lagenaria]
MMGQFKQPHTSIRKNTQQRKQMIPLTPPRDKSVSPEPESEGYLTTEQFTGRRPETPSSMPEKREDLFIKPLIDTADDENDELINLKTSTPVTSWTDKMYDFKEKFEIDGNYLRTVYDSINTDKAQDAKLWADIKDIFNFCRIRKTKTLDKRHFEISEAFNLIRRIGKCIKGVEVKICSPHVKLHDGKPLRGEIDVLMENPKGELFVLDIKTTDSKIQLSDATAKVKNTYQITTYGLILDFLSREIGLTKSKEPLFKRSMIYAHNSQSDRDRKTQVYELKNIGYKSFF